MTKINIGINNAFTYLPIALLGTETDGKANFMALAWFTKVHFNPPMIAAAVTKSHLSNKAIRENKTFSVNFPSTEQIEITDYCGLVSGEKVDKSEVFEVYYGESKNAPMIEDFPVSIECKLHDIYEMPGIDLFIAEIVGTYTEDKYLSDGIPDVEKINPVVYTVPDNNYWNFGENVGNAYNIGKKLIK